MCSSRGSWREILRLRRGSFGEGASAGAETLGTRPMMGDFLLERKRIFLQANFVRWFGVAVGQLYQAY